MKRVLLLLFLPVLFLCASCSRETGTKTAEKRVLHVSCSKILASLDPALAADTVCQFMTASFYDTPLQYAYRKTPSTLEPSMLEKMPELSPDGKTWTCTLRNDLYFQENACFPDRESRRVRAKDLVFSILRLADTRLASPGFWLIRGKITGIGEFRERTRKTPDPYDFSAYDQGCAGLKVLSDRVFSITLDKPDRQFLYALAMPYFSAVSRRALEYWKDHFQDHPAGSGPFCLESWSKDHQIRLKRYAEFRHETDPLSERPEDRTRPLPLLDGIVCSFVKQPLSGWLLFLQGELDYFALDGENLNAVVDQNGNLSPALVQRGIRLVKAPGFETNYIGFHFLDPVLGKNEALRRAVTLAFDREKRIRFSSGLLFPAYGPVPPGAAGYLDRDPLVSRDRIAEAKEWMRKAGYPDGIDPATGNHLELVFDQAGSSTFYRQTAELLALDLRKIGIELKPSFNNRARFLQKIRQGQTQLFRLSWTGDYPDAENFLQLFYGPNAGASNRVCYQDEAYDRRFVRARGMAPSPERDAEYRSLALYLTQKCPWIFESHTAAFLLTHAFLYNFRIHDFTFNRWKYLSVDMPLRRKMRREFTPLPLRELR